MPSKRPVLRQQRRKAATGAAWAWVVAAKLLDELSVDSDDASAALDLGLAGGNPRRRLLVGSKGRLGVVIAVHGRPPCPGNEQQERSQRPRHAPANIQAAAPQPWAASVTPAMRQMSSFPRKFVAGQKGRLLGRTRSVSRLAGHANVRTTLLFNAGPGKRSLRRAHRR